MALSVEPAYPYPACSNFLICCFCSFVIVTSISETSLKSYLRWERRFDELSQKQDLLE